MLSFLPSYQTLGFSSGWKRNRTDELPYPLCHDRIRLYYLGRNAVYHGATALGLGKGDQVLFPSYYSGTESVPLRHLGCQLVHYGVWHDLSLDLDEIESKITPRTRALYAIHFHGFPGPIEQLRALADRYHLALIEDVALSFLARHHDLPLGSWGDISIFCLYKSMPIGAGGVLAVNRPDITLPDQPVAGSYYSELNLTLKHVLNHLDLHGGSVGTCLRNSLQKCLSSLLSIRRPRLESPDSLDFEPYILDRAMGPIAQRLIRRFDYEQAAARRRANYQWLVARLRGSGVQVLHDRLPEGAVPLFLPILANDKWSAVRALQAQKIDAIPVWGIHHPELPRGAFPGSEFLVDHLVEIPVHQSLREPHLERIARALIALQPGRPQPPAKRAERTALCEA